MLSFRLSHQILSLIRDILVMFKIMPFGFKLRNRISRAKKEVKNGILINSSIISSLNRKSWGEINHERNYKYFGIRAEIKFKKILIDSKLIVF